MEGHVFKNWAETHSCRPELYFEPRDQHELRQVLARARVNSKTVKVIGNGHSPSDIASTHGYMVSLKNFNKITDVNHECETVTVGAGILLTDLNQQLHQHGLALSVLGSVSDVSLAGAISTGTHGTGYTFYALHRYVLELWMMLANGDVVKLSRDDQDAEMFHASTLSLGALGIILSVTLQCERAFNLQQVQYSVPLKDLVENIDVHLSSSEHFRFMWYPHTDNCIAYHCNRTKQKVRRNDSWFWDYFIGYIVLEFLYWLSTLIPRLVPHINSVYHRLTSARRVTTDRSDRVFNFNCLFRQYVMEWAVPRDEMGVVLWRLKSLIDSCKFFAHFPVEVRFGRRDDDTLLSLSRDSDACFINIIIYRPYGKDVAHGDYWSAFQQLMLDAGGRPHWAKDFHLTPDQLRQIHPAFTRFLEIRNRLDPDRVFSNDRLRAILGD